MKCENCGEEILANANFCTKCGTKVDEQKQMNGMNIMPQQQPVSSFAGDNYYIPPAYRRPKKKKLKKWQIILIVLVSVIFLGIIIDAFTCDHEWKEATCTEPRICTKCEKTDGEALGHNWVEANCEKPKRCTRCSVTEGVALGHTLEDWTIASQPTYNDSGERVRKCSKCGEAVESETFELASYIKNNQFIFSPSQFERKVYKELNNIVGCNFTTQINARGDNSLVMVSVFDSYKNIANIGFIKNGDNLTEADMSTPGVDSILVSCRSLEEGFAEISLAVVQACDPSLSFDEAKELCQSMARNRNVVKNGIGYILTKYQGSWIMGITIK